MKMIDHISIIWAIARKDITNALKNLVMVSVALGVFVLVGSSQIGILLQQLSDYSIVYVYDTSDHNLAYSSNIPPSLRLVAVASDQEIKQSLLNSPGTSLGVKITGDNLRPLTVDASYAHWVDRNEANTIADTLIQFLQLETGEDVILRLGDEPIYPQSTTNRTVNAMSITLIIALFAFCGSLVSTLIVEEKRRKTWDILMVSPASVGEIITGKALAGMFYGLLTSCVTFILYNRYVLHWESAILVAILGSMLTVATGLFLGVLINSYRSINLYSAGLLLLLFLPLIPQLTGLDIADNTAFVLRLFPIPALMTLTRMVYINPVATDVLVLNTGILALWIAGITLTATWLASRMNP